MYILPLESAFGCFKVSLCIYLVFGIFGAIWLFSRVDLAFFAYGHLATLFLWDVCLYAHLVAQPAHKFIFWL